MHTNKELFKISKAVYKDSMLHQQVQAAGSNKAKFLERLGKKKKNDIAVQSIVMKVLITLYIIMFTVIPITSFLQINIVSKIPMVEDTWNLFVGGLSLSGFILLQPLILIIFSVTFTWGFLSKEPYTWINTLPFSRKDMSKISFFTILRGIDIHLIVLFLVLPIGTIIGINLPRGLGLDLRTNFLMLFICLFINLTNTVFNLCVVILLARNMAKVMEDQEENTKLANFIRIVTMLSYFIFTMLASYAVQSILTYLPRLFDPSNQFISTYVADIINKILSFIPFPFSGGYLLSSIAIGITKVPLLVLIGSGVGSILQIGLTVLLFRKALHALQGITSEERKISKKRERKKPILIEVRVDKPVFAYLKRDLAVITRELQTIIYMILPIMIPISTALAFPLDNMIINKIPAMVLYITAFAVFSTFFLVMGVTSIEGGGETITSSLPINIRDQIKAKTPLLFSIVPLMVLVAIMLQFNKDSFKDILIMTIIQLPVIFITAMFGFFLKIIFFGKLKYKFVIEEINTKNKGIKLIGILLIMLAIAVGFVFSLCVDWWYTLVLEGIYLLLLLVIFNMMFPKKQIIGLKT